MRLKHRDLFTIFVLLLACFLGQPVQTKAQAIPERAYNRFQYHKYNWQAFHTSAFHIYFPKGYDSLCAFTAREIPVATELVKKRMTASLQKEPNIIIYPSNDQLYESNIGAFESVSYTLPTVVLKGNRMLVAYNGSYADLKEQIREALVRSVWEEQFKTDLESQLKAVAVDDKIPSWFSEGMIKYFAHGWTIQNEDALRQSFEQDKFQSWPEVIAYQPKLAGIAFCYFLNRQYYRQAVMQLYTQLRKKKSLPRAVRLIAKANLEEVYSDCFNFYHNRFQSINKPGTIPGKAVVIPHHKGRLRELKLSPDGLSCAYTIATFHRRTVYIADLKTNKQQKVLTYSLPPWLSDHGSDEYPQITWMDKTRLLVALPEKGKLRTRAYDVNGAKLQENTLYGVDGISSVLSYGQSSILMSAFRKGQSDVVSYDLRRERYNALTDDSYDDWHPAVDDNTKQAVFASERKIKRPSTSKDSLYLAQGIFDSKDKKTVVSDTIDYIQWDKPEFMSDNKLLAMNTASGQERFTLINMQGNKIPLSPYQPYSLSDKSTISFYTTDKDSIRISQYDTKAWIEHTKAKESDTTSPWLQDYRADAAERSREDSILKAAKYTGPSFLEGVLTPKNAKGQAQHRKDSVLQSLQYDPKRVEPYVLQLHSAYFTAKVNNDYFINRYQPYLNYQGMFKVPEVGGMARGGFTDLFENHHFSIAYRMPAGTEGSDFFVRYENTARKTDWSLLWLRKVESLQPDPQRNWKDENGNPYPGNAKVKTNYYEASVNHPLSYFLGISFTTAIRQDRTIFLATEKYSLHFDDISSTWSISTLAANYNKLQPTLSNLYKGFKGRVALDVFKGLTQSKDGLYGASVDLQYHQPLYRYITAVASLQAGHSGGSSRVLYNMGGVDNNLTIRTDSNVHFAQDAPYGFQTLITPLRGYLQNSLYGNQYALFNTDVYFPLFQSLIPVETPLSFINNLQPGLFADIAYAKETWQKNPKGQSVWSYGISARTTLAGYPLRFDIAWPGTFNEKPVWYLSLSIN